MKKDAEQDNCAANVKMDQEEGTAASKQYEKMAGIVDVQQLATSPEKVISYIVKRKVLQFLLDVLEQLSLNTKVDGKCIDKLGSHHFALNL